MASDSHGVRHGRCGLSNAVEGLGQLVSQWHRRQFCRRPRRRVQLQSTLLGCTCRRQLLRGWRADNGAVVWPRPLLWRQERIPSFVVKAQTSTLALIGLLRQRPLRWRPTASGPLQHTRLWRSPWLDQHPPSLDSLFIRIWPLTIWHLECVWISPLHCLEHVLAHRCLQAQRHPFRVKTVAPNRST